jgi:tetratricopeptide (TPR) repeat protein
MNQNDYSTYESLDAMANSLPYGNERTSLREKAINLADLSGNERQQFEARKEFVNDVCFDGSFTEKYFTVFPWLLNYAQKKGTDEDKMIVLWYYKWVVMVMPEFPAVTKTQMYHALEDLKKRYLEYGSNEKVYHQYAYEVYMNIGEDEKSRYHHSRWSRFKNRDYMDDCEACVIHRNVNFHARLGNIQDALKVAQPLLTGKLKCTHVPKTTYADLLVPLMQNNREKEAAMCAEKLYKHLINGKFGGDNYYAYSALIYFSRQGEFAKAIKIFEKYMKMDLEQKNLFRRFYFYVGALYMFSKLDKDVIKLKLPQKAPFFNKENTYKVEMLREWFDKETSAIAEVFNKRNENTMMSNEKDRCLKIGTPNLPPPA